MLYEIIGIQVLGLEKMGEVWCMSTRGDETRQRFYNVICGRR